MKAYYYDDTTGIEAISYKDAAQQLYNSDGKNTVKVYPVRGKHRYGDYATVLVYPPGKTDTYVHILFRQK